MVTLSPSHPLPPQYLYPIPTLIVHLATVSNRCIQPLWVRIHRRSWPCYRNNGIQSDWGYTPRSSPRSHWPNSPIFVLCNSHVHSLSVQCISSVWEYACDWEYVPACSITRKVSSHLSTQWKLTVTPVPFDTRLTASVRLEERVREGDGGKKECFEWRKREWRERVKWHIQRKRSESRKNMWHA